MKHDEPKSITFTSHLRQHNPLSALSSTYTKILFTLLGFLGAMHNDIGSSIRTWDICKKGLARGGHTLSRI